jgi:histidinol-phosphate aminotransferase
MIRPRKHLETLTRTSQEWITRANSIRLDLNELVPHLDERAFEEIRSQLEPWIFTAYPEVNRVYQILAESLGISKDHFVLISGSDAGIRQIIEVFCDPGDALMISYPTYGMYEVYAQIFNLECIKVHYHADFTINAKDFVTCITENTKVIAIANPNGAIGCVLPVPDLEYIITAASMQGAVVLLDEAYIHYFEDRWTARVDEFDNLVLVRTFSKAGGIAGLRFGYILTNPSLKEWLIKAKPVVEINSIAAEVGSYLLKNPQIIYQAVRASKEGKFYLVQALRELGFEVYGGEANFVHVKFGRHKAAIYRELEARQIRVKDQTESELLGEYTRITIGPVAYMNVLLDAIRTGIKSL